MHSKKEGEKKDQFSLPLLIDLCGLLHQLTCVKCNRNECGQNFFFLPRIVFSVRIKMFFPFSLYLSDFIDRRPLFPSVDLTQVIPMAFRANTK